MNSHELWRKNNFVMCRDPKPNIKYGVFDVHTYKNTLAQVLVKSFFVNSLLLLLCSIHGFSIQFLMWYLYIALMWSSQLSHLLQQQSDI